MIFINPYISIDEIEEAFEQAIKSIKTKVALNQLEKSKETCGDRGYIQECFYSPNDNALIANIEELEEIKIKLIECFLKTNTSDTNNYIIPCPIIKSQFAN